MVILSPCSYSVRNREGGAAAAGGQPLDPGEGGLGGGRGEAGKGVGRKGS